MQGNKRKVSTGIESPPLVTFVVMVSIVTRTVFLAGAGDVCPLSTRKDAVCDAPTLNVLQPVTVLTPVSSSTVIVAADPQAEVVAKSSVPVKGVTTIKLSSQVATGMAFPAVTGNKDTHEKAAIISVLL